MVQQGGGRRNKTVASPDEVGPGPGFSPQSSSDLTMREKMTFKTKEGIKIFVYSTGIANFKLILYNCLCIPSRVSAFRKVS